MLSVITEAEQPTKRLNATERDEIDFAARVYDKDTPVPPAWDGTQVFHGIAVTAGRDHVRAAADDLLRCGGGIACDIETSGVSAALRHQIKVVVFGIADRVIALDPRDPMQRQEIVRLIAEAPSLFFHNAGFDVPLLTAAGLMQPNHVEKVFDTILMDRLAEPAKLAKHDLASVVKRVLGFETGDITSAFKAAGYRTKGAGFLYSDIDSPLYLSSAALDAAMTARIAPILWEAAITRMTTGHPFSSVSLDRAGAEYVLHREHVVQRVMLYTSVRGYALDEDAYTAYVDSTEAQLHAARQTLEHAGLRPGVGGDLVTRLDADGVLPADWTRTKTGKLSATKADWLKPSIAVHPLVVAHTAVAEIEKMRRDYLDKMLDFAAFTGRVHPQVTVLAAVTGRMSAGSPPVQQFPADARTMILADDPNGWVSIDYSAVEPMVSAYSSGQFDLAAQIMHGGDAYLPVAAMAGLPQNKDGRTQAKGVFLGLLYGYGKDSLAAKLGMSVEDSQALKARVSGNIPAISAWMDTLRNAANRTGMTITAAGRIAQVDRDPEGWKWKGYQAQNYFHQGSAYDLLSDAIYEIHRQGMASEIRFAIHDELVVTAAAAEQVQQIMRTTAPSLERFLASTAEARHNYFGTTAFEFPIDANELPTCWKKV